MTILKMNSNLMPLIKSGKKRATTRLGKKEINLGPIIIEDNSTKEQIKAEVIKVEYLAFDQLDQTIAQMENYPQTQDLKKALRDIYGPIDGLEILSIIYFKI